VKTLDKVLKVKDFRNNPGRDSRWFEAGGGLKQARRRQNMVVNTLGGILWVD